jgi:hypothetical protein
VCAKPVQEKYSYIILKYLLYYILKNGSYTILKYLDLEKTQCKPTKNNKEYKKVKIKRRSVLNKDAHECGNNIWGGLHYKNA